MSLPHLEISTFPSQIFWLFVATCGSYLFNKFCLIPWLSHSVTKRHNLIEKYNESILKMNEHIKELQSEIHAFNENKQQDSRQILENALHASQSMLLNQINKNNSILSSNIEIYNEYIQKQKDDLQSKLHLIVDEVKTKVEKFIYTQYI